MYVYCICYDCLEKSTGKYFVCSCCIREAADCLVDTSILVTMGTTNLYRTKVLPIYIEPR